MALTVIRPKDIPRRGDLFVKLSKTGLYFTVACVNRMELKPGDHVTFLNEGKHWEMAKTTDTEQFKIVKNSSSGLWLLSVGLALMIKKSMGLVQPNKCLYLRFTGRQLNNFEIIILSPIKPL